MKLRERIDASPVITEEYPRLKTLKVLLEYFDAAGMNKNGELKCQLNVAHAKSALWFACPGVDCTEGDFDLSKPLAQAVAKRKKIVEGELRCVGTRMRADHKLVPCRTLLRYKLNLAYA